MRLYIHMILCGSLYTLMYMLFDRILPYEFPLKWKRWLLRVNILFYLLPVPWLAAELRDVLKMLLETVVGITFPEVHDIKEIDTFNGTDLWKSMLVFNEEGKLIYITGYEKVMPVIKAVLVLCMTALFLWIVLYTKVSRQCKSSMVFLDKNHHYIQDQHTGKKVAVGISPCVSSPVTVGLIKPAILLPVDYHGYDDALKEVILHELNHVSCKDAIERFFCFGVIVVHIFNPLAYYLFREMIAVSEMISDEAALEGRTKQQKADYIRCIMTASQGVSRSMILAPSLGITKSLLRKRMERIMGTGKKKVWKKGMAVFLMAVCVLGSSIPAMAYQKPNTILDTDDENSWKGLDTYLIIPKEKEDFFEENPFEEKPMDFSHGDEIYVDANGMVYYNEGADDKERSTCIHVYEETTRYQHRKNSDGSCSVVKYASRRCKECGHSIKGDILSENIYKPCPH